MKFSFLLVIGLLMSAVPVAFAQNVQKTIAKPYTEWSKDEATKVLSSSPWADQYQSSQGVNSEAQQQSAREMGDTRIGMGRMERGSADRSGGPQPILIRLHSGAPIRQAIVRLQQIQMGYDKMGELAKKNFDDSYKPILECALCKDYYVVTITKFKDSSIGSIDDGIFQLLKLKDFQGLVWLENDKGEKRDIIQFTPPKGAGDSAVFFFKRNDDKGKPFLSGDNKKFRFVFSNEFLNNRNSYNFLVPNFFEFKIPKMMIGEKLEF